MGKRKWLVGVQLEVFKLPSGGGSQGEPERHFPKESTAFPL